MKPPKLPKKVKYKALKIPPPPSGLSRVKRRKASHGGRTLGRRCPCGKRGSFRTYDAAMGAAYRVIPTDIKRVYYCAEGGCYHFTGSPKMSKQQRIDELKMIEDEEIE